MKNPHDASTTFIVGFIGGVIIGFLLPFVFGIA